MNPTNSMKKSSKVPGNPRAIGTNDVTNNISGVGGGSNITGVSSVSSVNELNNDSFSVVNRSSRNQRNTQQTNTNQKVSICRHYANGNCRNRRECRFGLHISEEERNSHQEVGICYGFVNSAYTHSIEDCVKTNGGLCEHCAFGDCPYENKCVYRHDANLRYKYDLDTKNALLTSEFIICSNWANKEFCNGSCKSKHPNQCPNEFELSKKSLTCPPGCNKGLHQGSKIYKPKAERIVTSDVPLCSEIKEQVPVYEMGDKSKPRPFIRKVKEVNTEPEYYRDNEGFECLNLHSHHVSTESFNALPFKNSNAYLNSTVKSKRSYTSKRSNKSKEILSFNEFYGDITEIDEISTNRFSPALSPINVSTALQTTIKLNELAELSSNRIESPMTVGSGSSKKKLTIYERKKEKKLEKIKEKEAKRKQFKLKTNLKYTSDSDSDSDSD
jgi:hypothetical protein